MKLQLAKRVTELIQNESYVIFGSGSTVNLIIDTIASEKLDLSSITGFSASSSTSQKLKEYNIQECTLSYLHTLSKHESIICIDSLDQIVLKKAYSQSELIKGHGAALFKEKIVWKLATKVLVVLDESKLAEKFNKFIPIEIIPSAKDLILEQVSAINDNYMPKMRVHGRSDSPVITDSGNYLIDVHYIKPLNSLGELHRQLKSMLGVVETGIFTNENFSNLELLIAYRDHISHLT